MKMIQDNRIANNLTSFLSQANYTVKIEVYGRSHQGQVIIEVLGLNINVSLSVSAANLRVSLNQITVTTSE